MGGINTGRWLAGGIVAGLLYWVLEGLGSMLYMGDMETALAAHNLSMELTAAVWVLTILVSLIAGLTLIFFYVAARPRFGPGPTTAIIVAVAFWVIASLLPVIGYGMMGLFPSGLLILWLVLGLVETIIAALVGGWIYREPAPAPV